jgi:hypothetical protein
LAQSAADQERNDHVISFAFEGRPVRHREELLRLFTSEPVAQPSSLLSDVWNVSEVGSFLQPNHPVAPRFADKLQDY